MEPQFHLLVLEPMTIRLRNHSKTLFSNQVTPTLILLLFIKMRKLLALLFNMFLLKAKREKTCSSQPNFGTKITLMLREHSEDHLLIFSSITLICILFTGLLVTMLNQESHCIFSGPRWKLLLKRVWLKVLVFRTSISKSCGTCLRMQRFHL